MTDKVADIQAERTLVSETVEHRIERRLEVLREWIRDGVPLGKSYPSSLRAARVWDDAELDIVPIASPNEFTTTHHIHGNSVRDISELLTALKKRFGKPLSQSKSRISAAAGKFDRKAFDRQLEAAVSQWHTERDKHIHEKKRADSSEARSTALLEENRQKDKQISDLQRRLSAHEGLRSVK